MNQSIQFKMWTKFSLLRTQKWKVFCLYQKSFDFYGRKFYVLQLNSSQFGLIPHKFDRPYKGMSFWEENTHSYRIILGTKLIKLSVSVKPVYIHVVYESIDFDLKLQEPITKGKPIYKCQFLNFHKFGFR